MASVLIPFLSGLLGKAIVISLLTFVSVLYASIEYFRIRRKASMASSPLMRLYYPLLRDDEVSKGPAMAPLYLSLGVIACLSIFPDPIGYSSIVILSLGDGLGGLERILRGYAKNSSFMDRLRGSSLSFSVALLGASFFISPLSALFAVLLAAAIEACNRKENLKIDDNFTIPMVSALSLLALEYIDFETSTLNFLQEVDRDAYWFFASNRIEALNPVFRIFDWFTILLLVPIIILHALNSDMKKTVSFLFILGTIISMTITLKIVFQRPRPCTFYGGEGSILQKENYGFPSTHSALAAFLFGCRPS
ncbi:phosphatase PAP2 family protein, partial [Candidatus Bathyarchaeota archaeon]|nr:phosphatase PAP2 family protein [Candidatus Bathyarchaeota archaeon]